MGPITHVNIVYIPLDIFIFSSLDRLAYNSNEQVMVNLTINNNSAVDVSDSTLKVNYS